MPLCFLVRKNRKPGKLLQKFIFRCAPPNQLQKPSSDIEIFNDDISHHDGLLLVQ
jgi:hypothetical protein